MLNYTRNGLLNLKDINILNAQVSIYLFNFNFTNIVVII